jgi:lysozyme family protein
MSGRFEEVFERVIGHEGGYVNDPRDPGGETKFGISRRAYPGVRIAELTLEDAREIYRRDYWQALRCDDLPAPVDEFIFDFGVNSGVATAAKALQGAAGALRDGKVGPRTVEAVKAKAPLELVRLLFVERALIFARHHELAAFGRGWFARLFDKTAQAIRET